MAITVHLIENLKTGSLECIWKKLYQRATPCFFLSWDWIGNLVENSNCSFTVLCAKNNEHVVGLGVLFFKKTVFGESVYLHRTGSLKHDQTWIEYNDFLVDQDYAQQIRLAMVDYCVNDLKVSNFLIGASTKEALAPFEFFPLIKKIEWQTQSYFIDLTQFKSIDNYLESRSNNTRYQVNRSLRSYEKIGPLKLERADSVACALEWLECAAPHHIKRWQATKVGSGFNNPHFIEFHHNLIKSAFADGSIDILKITAGNETISYLYNFIEGNTVRFYLSANVYEKNLKHLKPGLVSHYLAIKHYLALGKRIYDFMGGDSQYKRSLATASMPIALVRYQPKTLVSQLVDKLRHIKQHYSSNALNAAAPPIQLLISGGRLNPDSSVPQYDRGTLARLQINQKGNATLTYTQEYVDQRGLGSPLTNRIFKGSALTTKNSLITVSETEVIEFDAENGKMLSSISDKSFNDLHHVIEHDNAYYIANTGMDAVSRYDLKTQSLTHFPVLESAKLRINPNTDYRKIPSTKPHLAHPNHCFVLNNEVWFTRCDLMDAVCLNDLNKRIFIGGGLVHDGVVTKKYVFFTTVNGYIKVFDKNTLQPTLELFIPDIYPSFNGWCRGIVLINSNLVVVGMSKSRPSKKRSKLNNTPPSCLLLVDIHKKTIVYSIDLSTFGFDAVFGIVEAP